MDTRNFDNKTALHFAAQSGNDAAVEALVQAGANIDACACFGAAINLAAWKGPVSTVRLLAAHGANLHLADLKGFTPLVKAAEISHIAMLRALIEVGAVDDPHDAYAALQRAATPQARAILQAAIDRRVAAVLSVPAIAAAPEEVRQEIMIRTRQRDA